MRDRFKCTFTGKELQIWPSSVSARSKVIFSGKIIWDDHRASFSRPRLGLKYSTSTTFNCDLCKLSKAWWTLLRLVINHYLVRMTYIMKMHQWCPEYHAFRHFLTWYCDRYYILWYCDKYHILWHCDNVTYGQLETNHKSGGRAKPQQQLDDGFLLDYWGIRGLIPTTLPCSISDICWCNYQVVVMIFVGMKKIRALCGNHQYSSHKVAPFVIYL